MTINDSYLKSMWNKTIDMVSTFNEIEEVIIHNFLLNSELKVLNEENSVVVVERLFTKAIILQHTSLIKKCLEQVANIEISNLDVLLISETTPNEEIQNNYFIKNNLNKNFVFSSFVIGKQNVQAQVSALACANNPGTLYNPLFIYGNSGLGKTHLLNAIGNFVAVNMPSKKIGILSGLEFVNCVFNASKTHELDLLKKELIDLDYLLIDDIQFIANKEKTHEIFFTIFNELVKENKQICLTCDRLPSEIKGLEERIISRFNYGLKVNIESPSFETALDILKSKLETRLELKKYIEEEALIYLANNFNEDVRGLEGSLNRLIFYGINFSTSPTITGDVAKEAFKNDLKEKNKESVLSSKSIIRSVCDYYNITKQQLISKNRTANIAIPRHIAVYLIRKHLDIPYSKIGEEIGKRDHSTIMNSCFMIEKKIKCDELLKKAIEDIEKIIQNV